MFLDESKTGIAFIASLIGVLFIGLLVVGVKDSLWTASPKAALTQGEFSDRDIADLVADDIAFFIGPQKAKVTVTEFLDFQCPFCRAALPTLKKMMEHYRGQSVKFVFRHFPISETHPFAYEASRASLCAKEQNRFMPLHDLLYQFQEQITSNNFSTFASAAELDLPSFQTCMAEKRYDAVLQQDLSDATLLKVKGTPTFFINTARIEGAQPFSVFQRAIDDQLAR